MTEALRARIDQLSEIQKEAVRWQDGAALVLAGPGAGKTGVLTTRIARLLHESDPRKFKVLALTFTTKAANEMAERVATLVPDLTDRTYIGTFHAFCASIIRQHGSHIGIQPDFGIFDQDADRQAVLLDAVKSVGLSENAADTMLGTIDRLKSNLITPEKAPERYTDQKLGAHVAKVYGAYEQRMRAENLLDFNGLVLEACRLIVKVPAVANRLRLVYPYWLIDEFQDTSPAQYRMLKMWAGPDFKNVFAVADDDQIIYQWAGASYRQLEKFREHFTPTQIQLVENHRCPASIVAAANRLVAHNTMRTPNKNPLVATKPDGDLPIDVKVFPADVAETEAVAAAIASQPLEARGRTAVIARRRTQLVQVMEALRTKAVAGVVAERRGRFVSPHFAWLQACLDQSVRPADRRLSLALGFAAERIVGTSLPAETILEEADAANTGFLELWSDRAKASGDALGIAMGEFAALLVNARGKWRAGIPKIIEALREASRVEGVVAVDVDEDSAAWRAAELEIRREKGSDPELTEFMQGLALRSKSPPQDPNAVSLLTVHASKGLEFDHVYLIGMAESEFPSFQSVKKGPTSPEMEEERRNCFVAVTRTKKTLIITRAERYRGYVSAPSRFLAEMSLMPQPREVAVDKA